MRSARRGPRSGITLTEILIAIMIMGIGLVSVATLFPLGLVRLRDAGRSNRSALLSSSAKGELAGRNLLGWDRFRRAPYYQGPLFTPYGFNDPWIQDSIPGGAPYPDSFAGIFIAPKGVYRGYGLDGQAHNPAIGHPSQPPIFGPGLPVAYDPLWRRETGIPPHANFTNDGRFGVGVIAGGTNFLGRNDPGDNNPPSAYGLQRLTNFPFGFPAQDLVVDRVFVSPDDIVYQAEGSGVVAGTGSPIVPDLSLAGGAPIQDFNFSWLFTGRRLDATSASLYSGDVVICHNRPLTFDTATGLATGERVVEGIFGFSESIGAVAGYPGGAGYSLGDDRVVMLRWPAGNPDPEIRVGSWIADVTYERFDAVDITRYRFPGGLGAPAGAYPGQRCHWYRVVKTNAVDAVIIGGATFRQTTVVIDSPVKAKTLLALGVEGNAYHMNAALIMPSVVNVFPVTIPAR